MTQLTKDLEAFSNKLIKLDSAIKKIKNSIECKQDSD